MRFDHPAPTLAPRPALVAKGISFADGGGLFPFTAARTTAEVAALNAHLDATRATNPAASANPKYASRLRKQLATRYANLEAKRAELATRKVQLDNQHTQLENLFGGMEFTDHPSVLQNAVGVAAVYANQLASYYRDLAQWRQYQTQVKEADRAAYEAHYYNTHR